MAITHWSVRDNFFLHAHLNFELALCREYLHILCICIVVFKVWTIKIVEIFFDKFASVVIPFNTWNIQQIVFNLLNAAIGNVVGLIIRL